MRPVPCALPSGRVIDLCDVVVATPPHVRHVMLAPYPLFLPAQRLDPEDAAAALAALHALPEELALDEFSEDA